MALPFLLYREDEVDINVNSRYVNKKTGNTYIVTAIGVAAWDVNQKLIIYRRVSKDDTTVWVRSETEFNEKFKECQYGKSH